MAGRGGRGRTPDRPGRGGQGGARPRRGRPGRERHRPALAGRPAGGTRIRSAGPTWSTAWSGPAPEMLVKREAGLAISRVLAGTIRRTGDDDHDLNLAAALAQSSKDLEEHEYAVRSVARGAGAVLLGDERAGGAVRAGAAQRAAPGHRRDRGRQLGGSSLALAAALHPSAAVCGTPTDPARALIAELEHLDRERYAGPVGWIDARGDGEWAIALRCGLISETDPRQIRLFAGCGIVAGSDPAAELAESVAKLVPMRDALGPSAVTASERVVAVVLAGGESRRFGSDKLAAASTGQRCSTIRSRRCPRRRLIIVGPARETVRPARFAREQPAGGGPAAALVAGLRVALSEPVRGRGGLPGDAPRGGESAALLLRRLRAERRRGGRRRSVRPGPAAAARAAPGRRSKRWSTWPGRERGPGSRPAADHLAGAGGGAAAVGRCAGVRHRHDRRRAGLAAAGVARDRDDHGSASASVGPWSSRSTDAAAPASRRWRRRWRSGPVAPCWRGMTSTTLTGEPRRRAAGSDVRGRRGRDRDRLAPAADRGPRATGPG